MTSGYPDDGPYDEANIHVLKRWRIQRKNELRDLAKCISETAVSISS